MPVKQRQTSRKGKGQVNKSKRKVSTKSKPKRKVSTKSKPKRKVSTKSKPKRKVKRGGANGLDKTIAQQIIEQEISGGDREALMSLCDKFFKGTDYEEQYQRMKNRTDKPRSVAEYEAINLCKNAALAISGQKMSPVRKTPKMELPEVKPKWYRRLPSPKKLKKIIDYFKPKPKPKPRFSDEIPSKEYLAKMRAQSVRIMPPEEYQQLIQRTTSSVTSPNDMSWPDQIPPPPPPLSRRPDVSQQQERLPSGYQNISPEQYDHLMQLINRFETSTAPPPVQRKLLSVPRRPSHTMRKQ